MNDQSLPVPSPDRNAVGRPTLWVLLALALTAVALRVVGAHGDLWLDEIWSIQNALSAEGVLDVFTSIRVDNNHWINSLYVQAIGSVDHLVLYRGLAVLCGALTLAAVAADGIRRGATAALTATVLFGFTYSLVHFDSEARGYGPAIFFGVAAYFSLQRLLADRRPRWALAFTGSATFGLLSQLTFAWIYAGFLAWSGASLLSRRESTAPRGRARGLATFAGLHALPLLALGTLLVVDVRHWRIAGSPPYPIGSALVDLVRFTFGVPEVGWLMIATAAGLVIAVAHSLLQLGRSRDPRLYFFVFAVVVGPVVFILTTSLSFFYPRYLAVSLPFLLLLLSDALVRLGEHSAWGRRGWVILLTAFLLGNSLHLASFLSNGRGQYRSALAHVLEHSPPGAVTLGFPSGSLQEPVVEFYSGHLAGGDRLVVHWPDDPDMALPDWILVQELDMEPPPAAPDLAVLGQRYQFVDRFPHWGLSGWTWDLYRLVDGSS